MHVPLPAWCGGGGRAASWWRPQVCKSHSRGSRAQACVCVPGGGSGTQLGLARRNGRTHAVTRRRHGAAKDVSSRSVHFSKLCIQHALIINAVTAATRCVVCALHCLCASCTPCGTLAGVRQAGGPSLCWWRGPAAQHPLAVASGYTSRWRLQPTLCCCVLCERAIAVAARVIGTQGQRFVRWVHHHAVPFALGGAAQTSTIGGVIINRCVWMWLWLWLWGLWLQCLSATSL